MSNVEAYWLQLQRFPRRQTLLSVIRTLGYDVEYIIGVIVDHVGNYDVGCAVGVVDGLLIVLFMSLLV